MRVYANDQEQLEALKSWWKNNGKMTIAVIVLAIVISFAWRYWQTHKLQKSEAASLIYEQMVGAFAQQQKTTFNGYADLLINDYSGTPYADTALLFEAKDAVDNGQLNLAEQKLQQVIKHGSNKSLKQVARIRAARILAAQQNYKAALALLNDVDDNAYLPAIQDVCGDIYFAMGNNNQARKSYQDALENLPATDAMRALVQMKMEQLAESKN